MGYGKGKDFGYGKGNDDKGYGKGKSKAFEVGPEDMDRCLYVGNLPFRASWQSVKDMFKEYGNVIRCDIAKDYDGRSRGYANVLFETQEDARAAIDNLNGADFEGRSMVVRFEGSR